MESALRDIDPRFGWLEYGLAHGEYQHHSSLTMASPVAAVAHETPPPPTPAPQIPRWLARWQELMREGD